MTTTQAATTAPVQEKALTKMAQAKIIFDEIYAEGYKFKMEGAKSQRNEFIKRAIAEFGMTTNGAATYFQNLTNLKGGKKLYQYNRSTKSKVEAGAATDALQTTTSDAKAALGDNADNDKSPAEGAVGKFRWMVMNAAGEELSSWATRSIAQAKAKEVGADWADRKAAAAAE